MLSNLEDVFYKLGFYIPTWRTLSTNWGFMLQLGGRFSQIGILRSNLEDIFYKLGFYAPTWRTLSTNWDFMLQLGGYFLQVEVSCSNLEDAFYSNKDRATELFNTFFHQLSFLLF